MDDPEKNSKINETAEIIKYTFKPQKNSKKGICKRDLIYLRQLIGLETPYAWISRSWIYPAFEKAGFLNNHISISYNYIIPTTYFNLLWIQRIPKEICDIITSYVDINNRFRCDVCQKDINYHNKKHKFSKIHLKRLANAPEYFK